MRALILNTFGMSCTMMYNMRIDMEVLNVCSAFQSLSLHIYVRDFGTVFVISQFSIGIGLSMLKGTILGLGLVNSSLN